MVCFEAERGAMPLLDLAILQLALLQLTIPLLRLTPPL